MTSLSIVCRLLLALLAWLVPFTITQAQTRLGLTDAIRLGLKNRFDVQANQLNVSLAKNSVQKNRNAWLPNLDLSGNVRYNTQLQQTVIPAGFGTNSESQRIALGTKNSTIFSLDLTQPIYNPALKTQTILAGNTLLLETEKNNQKQTNLKIQIAESYLNVLLQDLQRTEAQAEEQRYKNYLTLAEGKYNLGTLLETDYQTTRVDYRNAGLSRQKAEQRYALSLTNLRYQLNLPPDTPIELTDRLDPAQLTDYPPESSEGASERTELRQARLQQESYRLQTQYVLEGLKPTLSLYANYSVQFLSQDVNYFSNKWGPYNYLGLRVTVPLGAQFTKKTNLLTYKLYARQADLNLSQTRADIDYEVEKTKTEYANAVLNLQSTKATVDVSNQLYQVQQQTYQLGTVLYSTVLDTEKNRQTASQNYLRAAYDYLVARLNYEKTIGKY